MKLISVLILSGLVGCGYSSRNNELTGQVKKVIHQTPIICPNRVDVDISLGVMRNGVGSMSSQDVYATVINESDVKLLEKAAEAGALVKLNYDQVRLTICNQLIQILKVEVLP